jgi:hypothetical protein
MGIQSIKKQQIILPGFCGPDQGCHGFSVYHDVFQHSFTIFDSHQRQYLLSFFHIKAVKRIIQR